MESGKYCVYNQTRENFLSLGVSVADTAAKQLKVLMDSLSIQTNAGLWLTPFRGVPATKGLSPVDLIYLDEDNRVIQAIESFPNHAIEPTRDQPASALVLAGHTIFFHPDTARRRAFNLRRGGDGRAPCSILQWSRSQCGRCRICIGAVFDGCRRGAVF